MDQKLLPFLFLDLETTGHDPLKRVCIKNSGGASKYILVPWHEIIDVGAVMVKQDLTEMGEPFSLKVKPEHPERCLLNLVNDYPKRAVTGEWENAVSLHEALIRLFSWIQRTAPQQAVAIPGGQNWFFDWSFLVVAFAACGIIENEWRQYLHYTRFDTRSMAIQELWEPGTPYDPSDYSLRNDRLAKRLGIPAEPYPHEALNGAREALMVYRKLVELKKHRLG